MGVVFDVCEPVGALVAVSGLSSSVLGPDYQVGTMVQRDIDELQARECSDGMSRYAHMTWTGPGPLRASPEEATEAVQEWQQLYGYGHSLGSIGHRLGYELSQDLFWVDVPVDEVVLLWDSVAVTDGELLGLVQNRSAALFAREVTVALGGHSWVFPLTVQPGEVAPFVVGAGAVSALPERSEIKVGAAMSPLPDLSRSFFGPIFSFFPMATTSTGDLPWVSRALADPDLGSNWAAMDLPLGPDDWIREWHIQVDLVEPNSHPGIAGTAAELVIEDMRAYLTFIDEHGRVLAVHRLTPTKPLTHPKEPLSGLPVIDSDGDRHYGFDLEFYWLADSEYDRFGVTTVLHVGGGRRWTQ